MRKRLLVVFLAVLVPFGPAVGSAAAQENGQGDDNAAVAVNLHDGASIIRFAFDVRRTMSDVVEHTNTAVAYSQCEDCQTVALAVQTVLVASEPSVVTPENVALAVNYQCTSCETFAAAYQFIIGTDGRVRFTAEGRRELNRIRQALRELLTMDLPFAELQARIDELMDRLRWVLSHELVPVHDRDDDENDGQEQDRNDSADPAEETTTVETTETVTTDTGTRAPETTTRAPATIRATQ